MPLDRVAEALQSLPQPVLDRVDPCLVVAAGVNARKVAQVGHVLIEVLLEVGDNGVAHHCPNNLTILRKTRLLRR